MWDTSPTTFQCVLCFIIRVCTWNWHLGTMSFTSLPLYLVLWPRLDKIQMSQKLYICFTVLEWLSKHFINVLKIFDMIITNTGTNNWYKVFLRRIKFYWRAHNSKFRRRDIHLWAVSVSSRHTIHQLSNNIRYLLHRRRKGDAIYVYGNICVLTRYDVCKILEYLQNFSVTNAVFMPNTIYSV